MLTLSLRRALCFRGSDGFQDLLVAAVQAGFLHSINCVLQELVRIFLVPKAEVPGYPCKDKALLQPDRHLGQ